MSKITSICSTSCTFARNDDWRGILRCGISHPTHSADNELEPRVVHDSVVKLRFAIPCFPTRDDSLWPTAHRRFTTDFVLLQYFRDVRSLLVPSARCRISQPLCGRDSWTNPKSNQLSSIWSRAKFRRCLPRHRTSHHLRRNRLHSHHHALMGYLMFRRLPLRLNISSSILNRRIRLIHLPLLRVDRNHGLPHCSNDARSSVRTLK